MSLRDLLRGERLKIQLALNEAKGGGAPRGSLLGGGVLGSLLSQKGDIIGRASPRNRQVAEPGEPANFEPKTPILSLFMQGSRPLRETAKNLILSTQQPQQESLEASNLEPQIGLCPMCRAQVLESFEFCPACAHILRAESCSESSSLSISMDGL